MRTFSYNTTSAALPRRQQMPHVRGGNTPGDLLHPAPVGLLGDPGDVHAMRLNLDHEEDVVAGQT